MAQPGLEEAVLLFGCFPKSQAEPGQALPCSTVRSEALVTTRGVICGDGLALPLEDPATVCSGAGTCFLAQGPSSEQVQRLPGPTRAGCLRSPPLLPTPVCSGSCSVPARLVLPQSLCTPCLDTRKPLSDQTKEVAPRWSLAEDPPASLKAALLVSSGA